MRILLKIADFMDSADDVDEDDDEFEDCDDDGDAMDDEGMDEGKPIIIDLD